MIATANPFWSKAVKTFGHTFAIRIAIGCILWLGTVPAHADILLREEFSSGVLPTGWTNNILAGTQGWSFRSTPAFGTGGNYAVFDDQVLGAVVSGNRAALESPAMDFTGRTTAFLRYQHHWFGIENTLGRVEVSVNGGAWTSVASYSNITQGSLLAPQNVTIDISALAAGAANVRVRFNYFDGNQFGRFWYLDNVIVFSGPDVGVTALVAPAVQTCATSYSATEAIRVRLFNYTPDDISVVNLPIQVAVTGMVTVTHNETWTGTIPAEGSVEVTLAGTVNMTAGGTYQFVASTGLATDAVLANNSFTATRSNRINAFPYLENFNANNGGWIPSSTTGSRWEYGALPPTYAVDGPDGLGNSWYFVQAGSGDPFVESPLFNLSTTANPVVRFKIKLDMNSNGGWNGVRVQWRTNTTGWTDLGTVADPTWYGAAPHGPSNSWGGNHSGTTRRTVGDWLQVERNLCFIPVAQRPCVQFRMITRSQNNGIAPMQFAFDDFEIIDNVPDVGATLIVSPGTGTAAGCDYNQNTQVTVRVHNFRCDAANNIPLQVSVTGPIPQAVNEVVPTVAGNSFVDYTFTTALDLTAVGSYTLTATTNLAGDQNPANNSTTAPATVTVPTINTYPYFEDFNATNGLWQADIATAGQQEWTWGALPPTYTVDGPDGQGNSWRLLYNGGTTNPVVNLTSPIFDLSAINNPELVFDFKLDINSSGGWNGVFMQYTTDNGVTWTTLGNVSTPDWYTLAPHGNSISWGGPHSGATRRQVGDWTRARIRLCDLGGETCVRFRYTLRSPNRTVQPFEFAVDNFFVGNPEPYDISLLNIQAPGTGNCTTFGAAENVTVVIESNACVPLYNLPVSVTVAGPTNTTLNGVVPVVPRRGRATFTFPTTVSMSTVGTYTFTANVTLPPTAPQLTPEPNTANNTLVHTRTSVPISTFPFTQNFNANNGEFAPRPVNADYMWLWGPLPATYTVDGPDGQGSSWRLYAPGGSSAVQPSIESPHFNISSLQNPVLALDIKMDINSSGGWNGVYVDYSTNGGTSWTTLGTVADPTWYGAAPHGGSNSWGAPHSGITRRTVGDWLRVERNLCPIPVAQRGCVKFRVITRSVNAGLSPLEFAIDNFTIFNNAPDVAVSAILEPQSTASGACGTAASTTVTLRVHNYRCDPVTNVPVTINATGAGTASLSEVVPNIPGNSFVDYTFSTTLNLGNIGVYDLKAFTSLVGDVNLPNDTARSQVTVTVPTIDTYPYIEDFNADNGNWEGQVDNPDQAWLWGPLPPTYTVDGPDGEGNSWHVRYTAGAANPTVNLISPIFDLSKINDPELSFDFKLDINSSGGWNGIFVQYTLNNGGTWTTLGDLSTPDWYNLAPHGPSVSWGGNHSAPTRRQVSDWTRARIRLCQVGGETCVRFRFTMRSPNRGVQPYEFAMDNFSIADPRPYDVSLLNIQAPGSVNCTAYGNAEQVTIVVENTACVPIENLPVSAVITGPVNVTLNGVLPLVPRLGRATYTFPGTVNMSAPGTYTITANVSLPVDAPPLTPETDLTNNTLVHTRISTRINSFPYVQNFDGGNAGFSPRPVSPNFMWLWGPLPATYAVDGPDGQGSSWRLYTPGGGTTVQPTIETPVFDLTGLANPQLTFDIKMDINSSGGWNGVYVEYSTNGGTNWTQLGTVGEPTWYGAAPHGPSNSWGGLHSGATRRTVGDWLRVTRNLCPVANQACVKFRIITRSVNPGLAPLEFAIDNFRIETGASDAGVSLVLQPTTGGNSACSYREQVPTQIRVFNFNCAALTNVPVVMEVTGPINTTLTEQVPTINPNTSIDYTFTGRINLSVPGTYTLRAYSALATDADNSNDTAVRTIQVLSPIINTFPYLETFNGSTGQWLGGGTTPTATWEWTHGALPPTYAGGPQGAGDSWRLTATAGSGDLFLFSPVFDFTGVNNPVMTFDFKLDMNSNGGWNGVFMERSIDGGQSWTQLGDLTSPNWYNLAPHGPSNSWGGNHSAPSRRTVANWTRAQFLLCAFANQSCVQFRFRTRSPNQGVQPNQFAVDNFTVTNTPLDAELTSVTGCYGAQYNLQVGVRNLQRCPGAPTITSAQITYEINGVRTNFNATGLSIAPNANQIITIPNVVIPNTSATLRVWVKLPNGLEDQIVFNDTIVANLASFPNCNDHCSKATPLAIGTTLATQNTSATGNGAEDGEFFGCPIGSGSTGTTATAEQSVWYSFTTGPVGGNLTISFTDIVTQISNGGLQVEIMEVTGANACDPNDRTTIHCANPNAPVPIVYGPNAYPPNTTYMIMIDAAAGEVLFNILIEGDALAPVTGGEIAANQTVCVGQAPNPFTNVVAPSSGVLPYVYQWQRATNLAGPWTNMTGTQGLDFDPGVANTAGTFYYRRRVQDDNGTGDEAFSNVVTLTVTADVVAPVLAATTPACQSTTLAATTTPPAGTTWYWQADAVATVADPAQVYNAVTPRTITTSGTYYLRAYNGICWSDAASIAIVIDTPPAAPGALTATTPACTSTGITAAGTPDVGATWYWQTSATGLSIANAYTGPRTVTVSGTYYLRANRGTCWSAATSIAIVIDTPPAAPGALTGTTPACEATTITATGTPDTGVNWYWQVDATGESTVDAYAGPRTITTAGTYYLRANRGACWSAATSIAVVIDMPPAAPGALTATTPACVSTDISAAGMPEAGATWYWQTSATGESTVNAYTGPRTVNADGTYYLRANRGTCWSAAVSVVVQILPTPNTPGLEATPGNTVCAGSISIDRLPLSIPGFGETHYWQTSATGESTADPYTGPRTKSLPGDSTLYLRAFNGTCWGPAGSLTVTVTDAPVADAGADVLDICGDRALLNPVGTGTWRVISPVGAPVTFVGNEAQGLTQASYEFEFVVTSPGCPEATDRVRVTREVGNANFSLNSALLELPDNALLTALDLSNVPAGSTYSWQFVGGTPASFAGDTPPAVRYATPGSYPITLTILSPAGCSYVHTATVLVTERKAIIVLPNVFSPNNDGLNDIWPGTVQPWPDGVVLQVFNRWGVVVYSGRAQWDGRSNSSQEVPEGVYFYRINIPGYAERSGNITLVR